MRGKELSQLGVTTEGTVPGFAMDRILNWASPDIEVRGSGNLVEARDMMRAGIPHVVIANHLSNADGPVIKSVFEGYRFPDPVFIRGTRLNEQWFTRFMAGGVNGIPVWPESVVPKSAGEDAARSSMNKNAVEASRKVLERGNPLVIFPEGTRSREGHMRDVSPKNTRYFALVGNTRILPIGLWGTEQVFPVDRKFPRRGFHARFAAGKSTSVQELTDGIDVEDPSGQKEIMDRVMRLVAELVPEQYRGAYRDLGKSSSELY